MRQFNLTTTSGDVIDLTTPQVLFHDPEGLGFSHSNTYRRVGNRFILIKSEKTQDPVSGSIAFLGEEPYKQYLEFIETVSSGGLILGYSTEKDVWFYRDVIISEIGKTEILQEGYLDISISFDCLTPWYNKLTVNAYTRWKDSSWSFGSVWPISFAGGETVSINVDVDSTDDSPCCLSIQGPISNPVWKHYVNGVFCCSGKLTVSIEAYEEIHIDNRGDDYTITRYNRNDDSVQDLYQQSDFSTKRFLWLKKGHNHIEITGSGIDARTWATLEANLYYDTV